MRRYVRKDEVDTLVIVRSTLAVCELVIGVIRMGTTQACIEISFNEGSGTACASAEVHVGKVRNIIAQNILESYRDKFRRGRGLYEGEIELPEAGEYVLNLAPKILRKPVIAQDG